jgi:predicted metalloprotease with PDZ domain
MKEADWKAISHASGPGGELSYERGAAIALWADAEIRTRSGGRSSLDNVMFDLVKQAQAATPPPDFTEERVMGAFAPYLSPTDMARLRGMAVDGADVPLPEKLGRCAERRKETRRVVDAGFDEQTSFQQKRVTGVVQGGAAYQAGLRDGQVLFRWSIYHEDPSKDALLGVVVNGEKKVIHFSPAKQQEVEQYHATGEGDAAKACTPF